MIVVVIALLYCTSSLKAQCEDTFCSGVSPILPIVGVTFNGVYTRQPYKIIAVELSDKVRIYDNICYTYIKSPRNDTYIAYDARTVRDGTLQAFPSLTVDGGPGIVISSSETCTYTDYTFASIDECQIDLVLRWFNYGYCHDDSSTDRSNEVYALTSLATDIDDSCIDRILQTFADYGFGDRELYFYPRTLKSSCVSAQLCSIPTRSVPGYPDIHY